jgi:hypothetical protein
MLHAVGHARRSALFSCSFAPGRFGLELFEQRNVICRPRNRYRMLSPSPPIPPCMRIPVALCLNRIIGSSEEELARLGNLLRCVALSRHD